MVTYVSIFVIMANLATITTTINAVVPAIYVRTTATQEDVLVGNFSFELRGKVFTIIGSTSKLKYDLTSDTILVNAVSCDATTIIGAFQTAFVK